MTASSSTVSISNRSLLSIGARAQVSNLSEGSTESDAIAVLFQPTYEALARTAPWNCLKQQATLSLIAAAAGTPENVTGETLPIPPVPWLYQYGVPSDSLQIRYILPPFTNNTATGTIPISAASISAMTWATGLEGQIPYSVVYSTDSSGNPIETILCNTSQAVVVYTVNQSNPIIWDSLFEAAMVASLAAYLVPALSLNLGLMDRSIIQARSAIEQARIRDGNEGFTSQNRNASWMDARMSGGGLAWNGGYGAAGGWGDMAWPG